MRPGIMITKGKKERIRLSLETGEGGEITGRDQFEVSPVMQTRDLPVAFAR